MAQAKPAPRLRIQNIWPDFLCIAAIAAFWLVAVRPPVIDENRRCPDVLRDAATAMNILNGQWWVDPAYVGHSTWYPPLSAILVAGFSAMTDIAPVTVYQRSSFWVNWAIPVGLFLVLRCMWGRTAAIVATAALLFAIPWWQNEVHLGQASIQAVIGGWIALCLYALQSHRRSTFWAVVCGLFQGLAFWHHPFLPAVLAGAFILQSLWEASKIQGDARKDVLRRNAIIVAVTFIIAAPVLYMMMHGPLLNPIPREYMAKELQTREFALMNGNPWIWATGIFGLIYCFRQRCLGCRLLLCATAITLLGQVPGYLRLWAPGSRMPMIVPHEFQVLFHLGWAFLVGIGVLALLQFARTKSPRLRTSAAGGYIFAGAAVLATALPGILHTQQNLRRYMHPNDPPPVFKQLATWIRANTDINDVFACDPKLAFYWLGGETGRKLWLTGGGHSNPRVDIKSREAVLKEMAETTSPQRFWELMQQHDIDYCIPLREWSPILFRDERLRSEAIPRYLRLAHAVEGIGVLKRVSAPRR